MPEPFKPIASASARASLLGAGVISLDVIESEQARFAAVGGSCGNVISILAWLGWQTAAIGRLGEDPAGRFIAKALKRGDVDLSHVSFTADAATPVVYEDFVTDAAGLRRHRFSFICSNCGAWLPRFRSPSPVQLRAVMAGAAPRCFYFDRVTGPLVRLAEWARAHGSLVVFEPSAIQNAALFARALAACHILKFAEERLGTAGLNAAAGPALIVRTEGALGAQARWQGRWFAQAAFEAATIRDAAGAGDWCSAGLIHALGQDGPASFTRRRKTEIADALSLGQALATLACFYDGARGLMTAVPDAGALNAMLRDLAEGKTDHGSKGALPPLPKRPSGAVPKGLCPKCGT